MAMKKWVSLAFLVFAESLYLHEMFSENKTTYSTIGRNVQCGLHGAYGAGGSVIERIKVQNPQSATVHTCMKSCGKIKTIVITKNGPVTTVQREVSGITAASFGIPYEMTTTWAIGFTVTMPSSFPPTSTYWEVFAYIGGASCKGLAFYMTRGATEKIGVGHQCNMNDAHAGPHAVTHGIYTFETGKSLHASLSGSPRRKMKGKGR